MDFLGWVTQNKETLKILFGFIITLICIFIVIRTNRLFKISKHKGIRYFRNAFFFYGIAFFIKYVVESITFILKSSSLSLLLISSLFEFFLIMAGFFLLYSLLWKKLESRNEKYASSLLNPKISVFYLMTIIIVVLDLINLSHFYLFLSQITVFALASLISFVNYFNNPDKKFLKFYFAAMVLSFITWILNAFSAFYFGWDQGIMINIYVINTIIFLLFLYGVVKFTSLPKR